MSRIGDERRLRISHELSIRFIDIGLRQVGSSTTPPLCYSGMVQQFAKFHGHSSI
jgi:hypothetical protein